VKRLDASGAENSSALRAAYSPRFYQKIRIWLFSFGSSAAAEFVSRMRLEVKAILKKAVSETIKKTVCSDSLLHFSATGFVY
jgi:hypothetical protein